MKDIKESIKRIKKISSESDSSVEDAFSNFFNTFSSKNIKKAQEDTKTAPPTAAALNVLSALRANSIASQNAHWMSKGETFYGDHLMYERIYNENAAEIDSFVEKVIPILGEKSISPVESLEITLEILKSCADIKAESPAEEILKLSLEIEKLTLKMLEDLYKDMKESNTITLGMDDLLMAMCNSHEGHIYLLSQRVK
jgi:DNA-binding ferritin-like protein